MERSRRKRIREIAISTFKAKCLGLLEEVRKTQTPIRVTRRGKPIADVVPASAQKTDATWLGSLAGKIEIRGDIVSPVIEIDSIEVLDD